MDSVNVLLKNGAQFEEPNSAGFSPLHIAAQEGHLSVVKRLVGGAGAKVDVLNRDRDTPLYWAAYNGHTEVVQYLVRAGNDFDLHFQ